MVGNETVQLIADNLQAAMPARLVTRSAKDFAQRSPAERKRGVLTLATFRVADLEAPDAFVDLSGTLNLVLLAEFELPEKATGAEVEAAEWTLFNEIREFLLEPGAGLCPLEAVDAEFSAQAVVPTGYVFVRLKYAELD